MGSSKGNKGRCVGEFNICIVEPPCEPLKELVYVIGTEEVISEYENKYRQGERPFNNYKQLNDETSLEWFCSPELIKSYESWDCKNLEKYKPSKYEINLVKSKIKEIKNLPTNAHKRAMSAFKNSPYQKALDSINNSSHQRALDSIKNSPTQQMLKQAEQWKERLATNTEIITQLETPLFKLQITEAQHVNKLITPAYLETTKLALNAFNNNFNHRDILSRVSQYTSLTGQILNTGINAQTAWDMLEPHRSVTESLQLRLRSYEPEEKPKETKKQLRKTIEQKDKQLELNKKEIAELKALIATSKNQDKKIEKLTRVHQLHTLIKSVDIALTENEIKPSAQDVWNEIEKNHNEYDDEAIIQEVKDNTIFWISKGGKEQSLPMTSISATLSSIRKKHKNN